MECRMCGFKFDTKKSSSMGCGCCGKCSKATVHCPNCGYANSLDYEQEFEIINKLKNLVKGK